MTSETLNPKTIREVSVKGPQKYQSYVAFMTKSGPDFFRFNTNATITEKTVSGPELEMGEGIFIKTGKGQWEKTQIGCIGLIKFYISPSAKIYSKEEFEEKEKREKEEYDKFFRRK